MENLFSAIIIAVVPVAIVSVEPIISSYLYVKQTFMEKFIL